MSETVRWAQFSYASFAGGEHTGSGGWQVGFRSPSLTEAQLAPIRKLAVTRYDERKIELPQFPTPNDLALRPQWFSYRRLNDMGVYVHAVPAGPDASLRPKNVFNHVLLDRSPDAGDDRPIFVWGAPLFQSPYGAEAVEQTELREPPGPVAPGTITRESAMAFLRQAAETRPDLLAVLLDALSAAVNQRGPRVVFGTDAVANAAHWVAAVSMLATPQWGRLLEWSLFGLADEVRSVGFDAFHFAAVPRSELAGFADDAAYVVIDEGTLHTRAGGDASGSAPASVGNPGELAHHRTAAGQLVQETEWSRVVLHVLENDPTALASLTDIVDEIGSQGLTRTESPEWPLAMAVLHEAVPGAGPVVAPTIEYCTPLAVQAQPWLLQHVVAVVSEDVGTDARLAFERLQAAQHARSSLGYGLLYRGYVLAALQDQEWQSAHSRIPLPAGDPPDVGATEQLEAGMLSAMGREARLLASAGTDDAREPALRAAALLDICLRLGLVVPGDPGAFRAAERFDTARSLERIASAAAALTVRLADTVNRFPASLGSEVLQGFPQLRDLILAGIVELPPREQVSQAAGVALAALFAAAPTPEVLTVLEAELRAGRPRAPEGARVPGFLFELAQHILEAAPQSARADQLLAVVSHGAAERRARVPALFAQRLWSMPAELRLLGELERIQPGWVPTPVVYRLAMTARPSAELTEMLSLRAVTAGLSDPFETRTLRVRELAEQYLIDPSLGRTPEFLEPFLAVQEEAERRAAQDRAWADTPSANGHGATARVLFTAGPAADRVAPNLEVFAPIIIAAVSANELRDYPGTERHVRAVSAAIPRARPELLVRALTQYAENGRNQQVALQRILIASLRAVDEIRAESILQRGPATRCLETLRTGTTDAGRKGDPPLVVDAVLMDLCKRFPEARQTVAETRDSFLEALERHFADDKKAGEGALRAAKRHFARILPQDEHQLKKLMTRVNRIGKGS